MKLRKAFLTVIVLFVSLASFTQYVNRVDLCMQIPDLTTQQKQKIERLSASHQETMDELRTQFWEENNTIAAAEYKTSMNSEMEKHFNNISALLNPEQKTWFDQNCNADSRPYTRRNQGFTADQGSSYGRGFRAGWGNGAGPRYGKGQAYRNGRGQGYQPGKGNNGYGRGLGRNLDVLN